MSLGDSEVQPGVKKAILLFCHFPISDLEAKKKKKKAIPLFIPNSTLNVLISYNKTHILFVLLHYAILTFKKSPN